MGCRSSNCTNIASLINGSSKRCRGSVCDVLPVSGVPIVMLCSGSREDLPGNTLLEGLTEQSMLMS